MWKIFKLLPFRNRAQDGFSLIELSVVIAIVNLIVALAIPNIIAVKIKAGRGEMLLNMNGLYAQAAAYKGEYGSLQSTAITCGPTTPSVATPWGSGCPTNYLGFQITGDVDSLRYKYMLLHPGNVGWGSTSDGSIRVWAVAFYHDRGFYEYSTVNKKATTFCRATSGKALYQDWWEKFEEGPTLPYNNESRFDALRSCFSPTAAYIN